MSNVRALLLVAEAGRGKTHLLCDVARRRLQAGAPTVLLIGGQFNLNEPWAQMINLLGLSCSKEEFLGALETAAQASGMCAVIMIDALNEGLGKGLWKKHLAGILLTVSKFPWLSIAISVRTSYEDTIVPDGLVPARLIRVEHRGFSEHEYEATKTFFDYFGIQRPSVPLLVPEFRNPLFLKIFCQGLINYELTSVPRGLQGITAIFKFYIDSVNKKLSEEEYLNFNPKIPIVWRAVEALAAKLAEQGKTWLLIDEAQEAVDQVLPRNGYENSLFRHLLAEGVIAENRFYVGNAQRIEGIHFAYERFTDQLVAKYLLDTYLNLADPASSFALGTPLAKYVEDPLACAVHRGLIEAFAVQIPERVGKELTELVPSIQEVHGVMEAFIDSLVWRDPASIDGEVARNYINTYVLHESYLYDRLFNTLLTVASNPAHPFNADNLHRVLLQYELAARDAWWSTFLHEQSGAHDAVDQLVGWAWSVEDKTHIEDEAIRLYGITLAWFLTTANRFLRDRATKALVQLLTPRIHVLQSVLEAFIDVDDLYVSERLMAVAYGCAMRSEDNGALYGLATDIYTRVFREGHPPVHILLRDYARGVIETALQRGIALDVDLNKVRPPYTSTFPDDIPSEEELKAKYDNFGSVKQDREYAQAEIWSSVMGYGDFARYIIGTNHGSFKWSSRRLGEPAKPTRKERYAAFVASLTTRQKRTLERYQQLRRNVAFYLRLDPVRRQEDFGAEVTDEQLNEVLQAFDEHLRKQLGKKKSLRLSEDLLHFMDDPHADEFRFDLSLAQRWILHRVFELGWTAERFGQFDRYINYNDMRAAHKPERLGKKYQWIAYHEFLARVADNFFLRRDEWSEEQREEHYEGPWQDTSLRDIDPSWVLPRTQLTDTLGGFAPTWWAPGGMEENYRVTDREWVRDPNDLPAVEPLIAVTNPLDHSQWWNLDGAYSWETVPGMADDEARYPRRSLHYYLRSYVVKQSDADELYEWMKTQWRPSTHYVLPDSPSLYDVFFGEYFWAPAYLLQVSSYHRDRWAGDEEETGIPKPLYISTDYYSQADNGYDCSIEESIGVHLPSKWIADGMGLRWNGREGRFYDAAGRLIAFDPSVSSTGPSTLLINRERLRSYLNGRGYTMLWAVTGEKVVITGNIPGDDWPGRLNILGVYRMDGNSIRGELLTQLSR